MLKKSGIILLLGLLMISLSYSSFGQVTGTARMAEEASADIAMNAIPVKDIDIGMVSKFSDVNYTTMVLDLRDPNLSCDFIFHEGSMHEKPFPVSKDSFMAGKMLVLRPNDHRQESIPLMWMKMHPDGVTPENFDLKYMAGFMMNFSEDGPPSRYFRVPPPESVPVEDGTFDCVFYGGIMFKRQGMPVLNDFPEVELNNDILQGQTNWHQCEVSEASTSLVVDMKWKEPKNDLRLLIYTPDGHILGPYYDDSDGEMDGRINLEVSNEDGLATGQWNLKVNGIDIAGKEEYYIRTGCE
ncbi:hypothetical protein CUJ83_15120 [Methanocella sp. CWC-04]|uniref:Uncharacterized protein n=1 Tax=Methanooceanicella nereidis TaxID=2052831 RepID=A0AAP2RFF5_9EURY|nr:hypothetical protein [Methanocella sp. CWC-04]MCD1296333.1 hypothetical protein [Methanocella sp. CWC-04]